MHRLSARIDRRLTDSAIRYGAAGALVAGVYLSLPLVASSVFGVPIEIVIPIAYVLAVTLHFVLQRNFVFRHIEFALSSRQQVTRYIAIGAFQYPTTALATASLPGVLGLSPQATYVGCALAFSLMFFLFLRTRVFHGAGQP
jgi:putative flippase GtrA